MSDPKTAETTFRGSGMPHPHPSQLEARVDRAAQAALARQQYVSAIDVLCGIGLLAPSNLDAWRKGRVDFLEQVIQGNPVKIASSMAIFTRWATERGLKPAEASYVRPSRSGQVDLQFSKNGDPEVEKRYRTHYLSAELSATRQRGLEKKLNQPPEPVVFQNLRESQCFECGTEIAPGDCLFKEAEQALCLHCAGMDDLEFVPRGDAALTRRAAKYSERAVVVVRFSRSRGRYERQGLLVEATALEKAERECVADAEERAAARVRGAERRREQDKELVAQMAKQIHDLFPGCPAAEVIAIAEHTGVRGSGRVGRSEAGRNLDEHALALAVAAAVRHKRTNYDELLASGVERMTARKRVADRVETIMGEWRS